MSRPRKILAIVAGSIGGLIVLLFLAVIIIVQTSWFRNLVREKIVTAVEDATGGKVDIASFNFEWTHLRAQVRGFVVHGLEPPTAPPLLSAKLVQVDLKLLSPLKGFVDIAYLLVDTPAVDVMVFPDGRTNIPAPKIQAKSSNKTGLETIVDLAIGHFDLRNGSILFANQPSRLNVSGANLRAQIGYNALTPSYKGEIDIAPLYVKSGNNQTVDVSVKLPLTAEKDKVTLTNAELTTPESHLVISGAMDHLIDPRTSAHVNGSIALDEVRRAAGLTVPLDTVHGPRIATVDLLANMADNRIQVQTARLALGHTNVEASGTLKDASGAAGSLQFNASLALGELGRLMRLAQRPEGEVQIGGNAKLDANNNYLVTANVAAHNVAFRSGTMHLAGVDLASAVSADPHRIELTGMRLSALGGNFAGSASLVDMAQFHVNGDLRHFDIDQLARLAMHRSLGYDGVVSGPVNAEGNIKNMNTLVASANLGIVPGRRGIPVSGHLGVNYNARADSIVLDRSHINLPHTTLDLAGSLGKQVQVKLTTRDFADFRPLAVVPVTFARNGELTVNATVNGSLSAPHIVANVTAANFAVEGRPFTSFTAGVAAAKNGATITNAVLNRGALQANFSASVGLTNWSPEKSNSLRADLTIRNADLRDIMALAGQPTSPVTGTLTADAHINGTIGSPQGNADLAVAGGAIEGEPFDRLTAHAAMTPTEIDVPTLQLVAGPSHVDLTATYRHALNDLQNGNLVAHVASNQVQLAQFQSLVKDRPGLHGILNLNADAAASIRDTKAGTDVQISNLNAVAAVHGLAMEGKNLGDVTVNANSSGNNIVYAINSDFAGSTIKVSGQSAIAAPHQTTANAQISNLPVDRVLAIAGHRDLPVRGTLALNGQVSGTLQDPRAAVNVRVTNGAAYDQPFNSLRADIDYTSTLADLRNFRLDIGSSYLEATASLNHPAGDLQDGQVRFDVRSNTIPINTIHAAAQAQPGLAGTLQVVAQGAATLHKNGDPVIQNLNANISAHNISRNKTQFGDLTLTASTRGNAVDFNLNSDLAHSNIRGNGELRLTAGYPVNAQLNFSGLTYQGLAPLISTNPAEPFDASLAGQLTVSGPVEHTDALTGTLQLTRLEAHSIPPTTAGKKPRVDFNLHNDGTATIALAHNVVTVQNFHITGPYTNLALSGTANIAAPQAVNLRATGNVNLELLEAFSSDIYSQGAVTLNADVTGTTANPVVNGRIQLQNASFNELSLPNGLSNANGTIVFNGSQALIQNITGETGGGKVVVSGVVSYASTPMQFRIQATATRVHIEAPANVTTEASARLTLTGTTDNSLVSGNVIIQDVALHSHSDIGSMLTSAATPPSASGPSTGFAGGLHFDIRIQTAPGIQFRTTLTQNLQADANLTLRGTLDHPGMLGRVTVTEGEVVFFGAKYTIDQGTVAFYDPSRINPVLNIDLETTVQGIDVSLSVSGPMDRMKLSYRSDPPMRFQDIVSLLASGKIPTTDPVLAANQPAAPQQSFEQAGASTLLGQAVANPVSGRLQRLFGVTKLSINPEIVGTSNTPQATLTLQQQITRDLTFTYVQDVTQSNPEAIRVEWSINPQFSAVAQRDIYGMFDLDFYYKKRFH
ncbi:MAG TPA: translocation/assembly module TamB domain-containing protein [Candidatus Limnocylindrales bacterium]|nr:translocation/assembly module TamB domain-containing protein [Candidatus Limnocylindrales bacterium]